jgi:hypothetical protein
VATFRFLFAPAQSSGPVRDSKRGSVKISHLSRGGDMIEFVKTAFVSDGFTPKGQCSLGDPPRVWLHGSSDSLAGLASLPVPTAMTSFFRSRRPSSGDGAVWFTALCTRTTYSSTMGVSLSGGQMICVCLPVLPAGDSRGFLHV